MTKEKTVEDLRVENTVLRTQKTTDLWTGTINSIFKWGALSFIAWCGYLSITEMAGKETLANFHLELVASKHFAKIVMFLFGTGGCIYGGSQRRLRKDTVARLQKRIKELELQHDPKRTTSELTPRGDTPKEKKNG